MLQILIALGNRLKGYNRLLESIDVRSIQKIEGNTGIKY